jgi:hypothetical protein
MQTVQIVDNQNRPITLVSGLEWHPIKENGLRRNAEIRKLAKTQNFDLKIIRSSPDGPHAGYARTKEGAKLGFVSIAACICERLSNTSKYGAAQNILVALKLPIDGANNWAFVSSRDGVILADGDFAADEETVRDRLHSDSGYSMGWDVIVCPLSWEVPRSVQLEFDYFFKVEQKAIFSNIALTEIFVSNRLIWIIGAGLGAGLLVFSGLHYKAHLEKQDSMPEPTLSQATTTVIPSEQVPEKPTPQTPVMGPMDASAVSLAKACDKALAMIDLSAGQWTMTRVECDVNAMNVTWTKGTALIADLIHSQPLAKLSPDGHSAHLQIAVTGVEKPIEDIQGYWPKNAIVIGQKMRAEAYGHEYESGITSVRPMAGVNPGVPAPTTLSFQASAYLPTTDLATLIDAEGVRAHRIVYDFSEDAAVKKTIFGVQYGQ